MKPTRHSLIAAIIALPLIAIVLAVSGPVLAQEVSVTPPEPLTGRDSYLQNCAPCHGTTGRGDGPSASGLSVPPTALADYDKIAGRSLLELFDITKNGNMPRMMPPWKNRLSDQEIWDTVAYAWTLHTSAAVVEQGRTVYAANCASCHGPDGKGAQPGAKNLADFAATSGVSQATWAAAVAGGKGGMPAFAGKLSDADQAAALVYVRSLSMGGTLFRGPLTPGAGVISGTVTNGTTGQPMPNLTVDLGIFDETSLVEQRSAQTDAQGVYRFDALSTDAGVSFAARTEYPAGIPYSSDFVTFEAGSEALDLPLSVYETTTDPSGLRIERAHIIVDFDTTGSGQAAGQALIAELMVFSLDGDRAYMGDGSAVLRFTLPAGATDVSVNEETLGGRYQQTSDGFVDLLPLSPGQNVRQIIFRYALPLPLGELELVRSFAYAATAVNALVSDIGQQVTSEGLTNQGVRQAQGVSYFNFEGQNVPAGQRIAIRMARLPAPGAAGAGGQTADRGLVFALVGAAATIAAGLVLWPIVRRRQAPSAAQTGFSDRENLVDALARLDRAYEAGKLPEPAYREHRLRLKAQLRDLLQKEGQG